MGRPQNYGSNRWNTGYGSHMRNPHNSYHDPTQWPQNYGSNRWNTGYGSHMHNPHNGYHDPTQWPQNYGSNRWNNANNGGDAQCAHLQKQVDHLRRELDRRGDRPQTEADDDDDDSGTATGMQIAMGAGLLAVDIACKQFGLCLVSHS